ncbi:MAG: phosphotransferase, partial [Clostridia bacterium]
MASNEQKQHQDTIPVRAGEELNRANLEAYLRENMEISDDSPLQINQFGLGASNLTYEIKIGSWEAVLRRPPLGPIAPKAHDMEREFRILRELHPVFPLAPKPFLYC